MGTGNPGKVSDQFSGGGSDAQAEGALAIWYAQDYMAKPGSSIDKVRSNVLSNSDIVKDFGNPVLFGFGDTGNITDRNIDGDIIVTDRNKQTTTFHGKDGSSTYEQVKTDKGVLKVWTSTDGRKIVEDESGNDYFVSATGEKIKIEKTDGKRDHGAVSRTIGNYSVVQETEAIDSTYFTPPIDKEHPNNDTIAVGKDAQNRSFAVYSTDDATYRIFADGTVTIHLGGGKSNGGDGTIDFTYKDGKLYGGAITKGDLPAAMSEDDVAKLLSHLKMSKVEDLLGFQINPLTDGGKDGVQLSFGKDGLTIDLMKDGGNIVSGNGDKSIFDPSGTIKMFDENNNLIGFYDYLSGIFGNEKVQFTAFGVVCDGILIGADGSVQKLAQEYLQYIQTQDTLQRANLAVQFGDAQVSIVMKEIADGTVTASSVGSLLLAAGMLSDSLSSFSSLSMPTGNISAAYDAVCATLNQAVNQNTGRNNANWLGIFDQTSIAQIQKNIGRGLSPMTAAVAESSRLAA